MTATLGAPHRSLAQRVGFGSALTSAVLVGTLVPFSVGGLAPFLTDGLDISGAQVGALTSVFYVSATLGSPVVGRAADVLGGRRLLLLVFGIAGGALVGAALAPSYGWLLVAMCVGGLAASGANPSTNWLLRVHVPPGRRGTYVGVKQSGAQLSNLLAGAVLPVAAAAWSWRTAIGGMVVIPIAGVAMSVAAVPESRVALGNDDSTLGPAPPRSVRWLAAYVFFNGAGLATITTYTVLFGDEALGMAAPVAGRVLALVGAAAIVARIVWGRRVERSQRATLSLVVIGITAIVGTGMLILSRFLGTWLLWSAAVVLGTSAASSNAVAMLAVVRAEVGQEAGRASGIVLSAFYAGLACSPVLFGLAVDTFGGFTKAWIGTLATFVVSTAIALTWHVAGPGREPSGDRTGKARADVLPS